MLLHEGYVVRIRTFLNSIILRNNCMLHRSVVTREKDTARAQGIGNYGSRSWYIHWHVSLMRLCRYSKCYANIRTPVCFTLSCFGLTTTVIFSTIHWRSSRPGTCRSIYRGWFCCSCHSHARRSGINAVLPALYFLPKPGKKQGCLKRSVHHRLTG